VGHRHLPSVGPQLHEGRRQGVVTMPAEEFIAAQLESRLGSLPAGTRLRVELDQDVFDGIRWRAGPHPIGWVERSMPDELRVKLIPTTAGREARALVEERLLDIVVSSDRPPSIRLTDARR
jgi:hypothetical protein